MEKETKLVTDSKQIDNILSNFPSKPFLLSDYFEVRMSSKGVVKLYDYFDDQNFLVSVVAILPINECTDNTNPESLFKGNYEWFGKNNDYYFWLY